MLKLIVFDCDGTLVDSQHAIAAATAHAFSVNGFVVPPRSRLLRYVGLSLTEAMMALTRGTGIDADAVDKLVASYRAVFHELRQRSGAADPMYPGAREAIESLIEQDDVLLGLATGKSRRGVNAFLEREGLRDAFVTIQTADDAPSKPHPAMLLQAMGEAGARAENTVMIGDTSYDMAMARAAKAHGIGVAWGYHGSDELLRAGASAVVQDFGALLSMLSPVRNCAVA